MTTRIQALSTWLQVCRLNHPTVLSLCGSNSNMLTMIFITIVPLGVPRSKDRAKAELAAGRRGSREKETLTLTSVSLSWERLLVPVEDVSQQPWNKSQASARGWKPEHPLSLSFGICYELWPVVRPHGWLGPSHSLGATLHGINAPHTSP